MFDTDWVFAQQRQERILTLLSATGSVHVADLVAELGVSDMTIRRDISDLAAKGLVRRVHGGAVPTNNATAFTSYEPDFATKAQVDTAAKRAIAAAAFKLVRPASAIALSAGTTTYHLAGLLAGASELRPLTVVTNSLPVSDVLSCANDPSLQVVLTGGNRTPSNALVGPITVATLNQLRVDQLFLGAHGIDELGLSTPNLFEAETNRALVQSAAEIIVLADHTKWGAVGLALTVTLEHVDTLICDDDLPRPAQRILHSAVRNVILVTPEKNL